MVRTRWIAALSLATLVIWTTPAVVLAQSAPAVPAATEPAASDSSPASTSTPASTPTEPGVGAVDQPEPAAGLDTHALPVELNAVGDADDDEEYFELLKLFADTLDQVERNYVEKVSRRELMEAAIEGVLAKLDQYSDYIAPEKLDNFRTGVESEFGGIGIRVGLVDGKLTVITPLVDTPAYRAGVLTGDQIVKIADESTEGMSLEQAITRMKGRIGSEIDLTVRHEGTGEEQTLKVQRELVRMETVFGDRRLPDDRWNFMFDAEHKIGYVRISSFSRHTHEDLQLALQRLVAQDMKGLILDLRFNPGGLLSAAIDVADLFLPDGVIVSTSGRNVPERVWSATSPGTYGDFPIAILVNRYSASASEIVAAALQDHQRAIVIGERTWGKGSVQNIIELEGGRSALKLTTAGYHRPSGKNIHRFEEATEDDDWGVKPDEGFEVKLSAGETRRLLTYQRDRDILLSPAAKQQAAAPERVIDPQQQLALDSLIKKSP